MRSFFSFHSPRKEQVLLASEVKRCTMRVNHASIISSELTVASPSSSHAILSSIYGLSLHQSDSLRWQDQVQRECGPAAALIRGNFSGVQSAAALTCHVCQISGRPLYSFTSHSHTSAADGGALGKWRARGKPWAALVRWDCIISNVTCPWTW